MQTVIYMWKMYEVLRAAVLKFKKSGCEQYLFFMDLSLSFPILVFGWFILLAGNSMPYNFVVYAWL